MNEENGFVGPDTAEPLSRSSWTALRRFVRDRAQQEKCDLCSVVLPAEHQHLLDPSTRQLLCACQACALLFDNPAATKYLRVPRRIRYLPEFCLSDALWDSLLIPVGMAFFFHDTGAARVSGFYPSPAGPTESLLRLESWHEIVVDNPVLEKLQPDVEALLVNRLAEDPEYFLVPIDKCYELVGLIRTHWRGLSGGDEVWRQIGDFYCRLKLQATVVRGEACLT